MAGGGPTTVAGQLRQAIATLAAAGVEPARVDAEWLLAGVLDVPRLALHGVPDRALPAEALARYADAVARRARREPLQQVLGWEGFRGLRVQVSADVLVPRPETETLVGWALELLPPGPCRILEVGTGSGCIACALAGERMDARVVATDVSPAAAALARRNASALGLDARVCVIVADLLEAVRGSWDLIVANLPYLPSRMVPTLAPEVVRHEPPRALDGGPDGLAVIGPLVAGAPRVLRPGGALVLETAGGEQTGRVAALMQARGFVAVAVRCDLPGVDRFVSGRVPA